MGKGGRERSVEPVTCCAVSFLLLTDCKREIRCYVELWVSTERHKKISLERGKFLSEKRKGRVRPVDRP